ncbi:MAG TPA: hypothetical protein VGP24_12100, partial [Glaciihabitans sp.]|nr:hypothetical protein [Glaciihabitans sp.]
NGDSGGNSQRGCAFQRGQQAGGNLEHPLSLSQLDVGSVSAVPSQALPTEVLETLYERNG